MLHHKIISITGGIGAGKSVVSAILATMGYHVYDCDSQAKRLMNSSPIIKKELVSRFGTNIFNTDGLLNKELLSSIIFGNADALACVNSIVHPAVRDDIAQWVQEHHHTADPLFVETALLKEGGIHTMVQEVWHIVAPLETRVTRVMRRNTTSRDKVMERIASQQPLKVPQALKLVEIINDDITPLLPQIFKALNHCQ